ncbi:MAG TPA: DNA-directed DNA polymerase, partial [Arthrobacter sp.]
SESASAQLLSGVFRDRHILATGRYRQALEADTDGREALVELRSGRPFTAQRAGWITSDTEMRAHDTKHSAWQDAIDMSSAVAEAIDAGVIPEPAHQIPAANVPDGFTDAGDHLRHLAFRGLADRYDEIPLKAIERLNLELERIIGVAGAAEYVLAAHDIASWCAEQDILTAARGTASGSMVLFCLGMTEIDPLRYDLKFDRFMRAGRDALPSLAFDIQHSRRQDVHGYLAARWPGQVARAAAFIRAKGESATRRYSRITEGTAALVDGRIQHPTTHACALLIAPAALAVTVPFRLDHRDGHENDLPTASWDARALEDQGYLVLNLLFSSALDVINRTADAVRTEPEGTVHVATLLPDGDKDLYWDSTDAAWDLIASGDTDGVFQLGSDDANAAAAAARPRNLTDMAVLIALSMKPERLDAYLYARKLRTTRYGRYENITPDESEQMWLAGALSETCGQLVFQEQVMDLFTSVGGFSNARAELAWWTLAKESPDVAYIREKFMEGAVKVQHDRAGDLRSIAFSEETAERVFDLLVKATPGAFCAAHAYSYARLAFQSAWMRAHFPETFQRVLDEARPMRKRRQTA